MKKLTSRFLVVFCLLSVCLSATANPFLKLKWPNTDFDNAIVDIDEIMSGGPPRDGIPSIDNPKFDDVTKAAVWLEPREPVILANFEGEARAYPLQLLIYHEIVNDQIGDTPISVTFCPLCNSSVIFDRRLDGKLLDFGTTGLLRKSDMVMYDRQTETWWQQIIGKGIIGELAGVSLTQLPSSIISFEDFAKAYPDGKVVNRETGHRRPYGNNPYHGYDDIDQTPFLFSGEIDARLKPMERVIHISTSDQERLYPFSSLKDAGILNDQLGEQAIVLFSADGLLSVLDQRSIGQSRAIQAVTAYKSKLDGKMLDFEIKDGEIIDQQTQSKWNITGQAVAGELKGQQLELVQSGIHFAFAWLAFNPDVEIYGL